MRVLILDCTGIDWTDLKLAELYNVDVDSIYLQVNKAFRAIRKLHYHTNLSGKFIWYGRWKKYLHNYDVIIIFSALLGDEIFEWIRCEGYKGRLIFYYRDPQEAPYLSDWMLARNMKEKCDNVELWSFDPNDSRKYGMKYNPQFYFFTTAKPSIKYDAVYVGAARGRTDLIKLCYKNIRRQGLTCQFVVKGDSDSFTECQNIKIIHQNMPYENIISHNNSALAIVEINQKGQSGLTVRALEALFMGKKLITNNTDIRKYDFYHPNNIFIIGENDWYDLRSFVYSPYHAVNKEIIHKYSADEWMKRFLRGDSLC